MPITEIRNLQEELELLVPDIETKIYNSTLDEYVITSKSVEGYVIKEIYSLKAAENGSKFKYEHELKETETLEDMRSNAHKQLDAWKFEINEKLKLKNNQND